MPTQIISWAKTLPFLTKEIAIEGQRLIYLPPYNTKLRAIGKYCIFKGFYTDDSPVYTGEDAFRFRVEFDELVAFFVIVNFYKKLHSYEAHSIRHFRVVENEFDLFA